MLDSELNNHSQVMADHLRAEIFDPSSHGLAIAKYMSGTQVKNNQNPKSLRLNDYDNKLGVLFLVFDQSDQIRAISSVVTEEGLYGRCAKIYGRFHIDVGISHTVIDRFFEPMTIQWCEDRNIQHMFYTINQENYKVLDWSCRRVGERRNTLRANRYHPEVGSHIRSGFMPLDVLIYERFCWQYVVYYSPDKRWFLERKTKALDPKAVEIFKKEFPRATQNWN